ncbi:signal peptidase II [Treponema sp.]|uniref:signal peptidase II n=1 Tax=Treponema sp. TaxID=166 RepID=UPI00257D076F|nr:signal peptidase II [Treponema sp.]
MTIDRKKMLPFILTAAVIILDQITKALIVKNIPLFTIGYSFFEDFLRIVHVANTGVAFSMGDSMPFILRRICFGIIPLVVIVMVIVVYLRNDGFNSLQRWAICGVLGGGLGNIIDRFFRAEGVVDFIDVKFYGLFGLERWPTFNVADASVVVCGILLVISFAVAIKSGGNKDGE